MKKTAKRRKVKQTPKRTPRNRQPKEMSVEEWQIALRREYGRDQNFQFKNLGEEPIFSEFAVTNPDSGRTYRIAIRGEELGVNFCSCPDFTVNTLGTCKHIEWLLAKLRRKRGAKRAFEEGFHPPYSEVYLEYGARRRVRFREGAECPPKFRREAERFFEEDGGLREETVGKFERFQKRPPIPSMRFASMTTRWNSSLACAMTKTDERKSTKNSRAMAKSRVSTNS